MKTKHTTRIYYRNYKRYIRKYNRILTIDPKSSKLVWLRKRILRLKFLLENAIRNAKLRMARIATVGMIGTVGFTGAMAQTFEYKPPIAHPFENINDLKSGVVPKFIDFDADGDDDLILSFYTDSDAGEDVTGEYFRYFENEGGAFIEKELDVPANLGVDLGFEEERIIVDAIDFDGDGDVDLFVRDYLGKTIKYLENNEGTLSVSDDNNPFRDVNFTEDFLFFTLGDIDGDGTVEAIVNDSNELQVFSLNEGVFEKGTIIDDASDQSLTLYDFDSDNDLDLIVGNKYGTISVYENISGSFTELEDHIFSDYNRNTQPFVAFSDLDSDGIDDLVVGTGNAGLFYNKGKVDGYEYVPYNEFDFQFHGGDLVVPEFVDMDSDGDQDMVLGNLIRSVLYVENNEGSLDPDPSKFEILETEELGLLYSHPKCADIDGDGDVDCVISSDFGSGVVHLLNVDGEFVAQDSMSSPFFSMRPDDSAKSFEFEDFDNDGDLDVFIGNKYGELYYFVNNDGVYEEATFPLSDQSFSGYADPIFADLDRDGDNDLVVLEDYGGIYYFIRDGETLVEAEENPFKDFPEDIYKLDFVDRDADGDLDVLLSTASGRALYFQNNDLMSSIEEQKINEDYLVFPNPANERINIHCSNNQGNVTVTLLDISGRVLDRLRTSTNNASINTAEYNAGNYVVQIVNGDEVVTKKVTLIK